MLARLASHARRNVVAYLALFVALGGTSYAATQLPKNSVGTKQIKKGAVTGKKVKDGSLTGADINAGTLGTVRFATNAANAGHAAIADAVTQPTFRAVGRGIVQCDTQPGVFCATNNNTCTNWQNYATVIGGDFAPAGFVKDAEGFVHLRGRVLDRTTGCAGSFGPADIFFLPPGYRPSSTEEFDAAACGNGAGYSGATNVDVGTDGGVTAGNSAVCVSLSGITFKSGG
jgi:hypothetical protein